MPNLQLKFRNEVELRGSKAATLQIFDNQGTAMGSLRIGGAGLTYFRPGPGRPSPIKKSWEEVLGFFESGS